MLILMPLGVHRVDLVALQHLGAKCPNLKNVVVVDGWVGDMDGSQYIGLAGPAVDGRLHHLYSDAGEVYH
jgi:hypothetical protein